MSDAEKKQPAGTDAAGAPGMTQEADIGSGEKSPGEQETDEMIKQVPKAPKDQAAAQ